MGKPRHKNKFFVVPVFVIILNYIALGAGLHTGLVARMTAVRISEISLIAIALLLIIQVIFICSRKINWSEFMIWFVMNGVAFYAWVFVVVARM